MNLLFNTKTTTDNSTNQIDEELTQLRRQIADLQAQLTQQNEKHTREIQTFHAILAQQNEKHIRDIQTFQSMLTQQNEKHTREIQNFQSMLAQQNEKHTKEMRNITSKMWNNTGNNILIGKEATGHKWFVDMNFINSTVNNPSYPNAETQYELFAGLHSVGIDSNYRLYLESVVVIPNLRRINLAPNGASKFLLHKKEISWQELVNYIKKYGIDVYEIRSYGTHAEFVKL